MKRVGIIGANGRLGKAIGRHCADNASLQVIPFTRADFDLCTGESVRQGLLRHPFDILVNCAAMTDVDGCETDHETADRLNGHVLKDMAWAADQFGARLIHFSTDYVFEGHGNTPCRETDSTNPLSYYGKSKLFGERCLMEHSDRHLVFRISWLFGAERPAFPEWILNKAMTTEASLPVVGDKWANPTLAEDVAALIQPCLSGESVPGGVFHLCNGGVLSWADYARLVLDTARDLGIALKTKGIREVPMRSIEAFIAPRPVYSALDTGKFVSTFSTTPPAASDAMKRHLQTILSRKMITGS